MHNIDLILTITAGLAAALLLGALTHRIGLSPIVGYLLAGIVVGPHTPGFVANAEFATQLAEVGVILLMFGVGLEFHFEELLAVRRIAIPGAVGQSLAATGLGAVLVVLAGGTWTAGVVFGLAVSVASTVVLMRVLVDNRDLHTPAGHVAVGWLVVEDLFTVLVLVLMPALLGGGAAAGHGAGHAAGPAEAAGAGGGPGAAETAWLVAVACGKIALMVAFTFVVGGRVIPLVLAWAARTGSRELFTLTVLVVALGIAVGSAKLFDASMALGAFLAGMVVGRSDFSHRAAGEALPMRDAFAVLFFVSVGMLFDPKALVTDPVLTAATLAIVLVGKPAAALAIVLAFRKPVRAALSVAVALAQIGEFTFILANLGRDLHVLEPSHVNALVAAAIVSITLNPLLYRCIDPLERRFGGSAWWKRLDARAAPREPSPPAPDDHATPGADVRRAVVVGYGPVGRTLVRLLRDNEIEPAVIELNLDTVRMLRERGVKAVYGDATRVETLAAAGVADAGHLMLSAVAPSGIADIIRTARSLNPGIHVAVRTIYHREAASARMAGADEVFSGEAEVALAMTEFVLREFGATPEQIDRERDRVRLDLRHVVALEPAAPVPGDPARAPDPKPAEAKPDTPGT